MGAWRLRKVVAPIFTRTISLAFLQSNGWTRLCDAIRISGLSELNRCVEIIEFPLRLLIVAGLALPHIALVRSEGCLAHDVAAHICFALSLRWHVQFFPQSTANTQRLRLAVRLRVLGTGCLTPNVIFESC